ncbi:MULTISPECIES: terpene synthase [unclassified Streptomyces]|uniref:terpene synthase family protein n=1 Tax=unclassified Streptomyces TaxID=2593676 RepID=UPI002E344052|nr:terpene synthase [Streptomyces sp. NBC_01356]WTB42380.1 terpene synthase [Streptomyces sp. NBC_00827]WUC53537.1 terpene synthase [Streptomyces sp. NBC_00554]
MKSNNSARELSVPSVLCPFPVTCDETAARKADEEIVAWALSLDLFPGQRTELNGYRFGTFAAFTHPDAVDHDHLMLAARNITALFAADDHYCDERIEGVSLAMSASRLAGSLTALENGSRLPDCPATEGFVGSDPVARALRETAEHITRLGTPAQVGRLRHETIATFLAMAAENGWRNAGHAPDPAEYLAHRKYNGAMACLVLIDVVGGYELPVRDWEEPGVRSLSLAASLMIMLVNDLYSVAKESADIGSHSLPTVLSARHGWSLERSMCATGELHDRLMRAYLRLEPDVARNASPELTRYLAGLRHWMRGNLEWHTLTGRHNNRVGRPTPRTGPHGPTHDRTRADAHYSAIAGVCPHCGDRHNAATAVA